MLNHFTGELAAMSAALLWAIASVFFHQLGTAIPPVALNFYKGLVALSLLILVILLQAHLSVSHAPIEIRSWMLLLSSGMVGIGIGDTAFFGALNRLGERRSVLMTETLAPPLTTMIAFVALSEFLSRATYLGMVITIVGVAAVIIEQTSTTPIRSSNLAGGIGLGLVAALCQSVGSVLSRAALTQADIDPLWSAGIRIAGGVLSLTLWLKLTRQAFFPDLVRSIKVWRLIMIATLMGTFMGIFLQQLALKHTQAGIAQTLLATSSLFIVPIVAMRGERVSSQSIWGAIVAFSGIVVLFLN